MPGILQQFTYTGRAIPLLQLLAPCTGKIAFVTYRAPGGHWVQWQPGNLGGEMLGVLTNSEFSVIVAETCTLRWQ